MTYDSFNDTQKHIEDVRFAMKCFITQLEYRADVHDASKFDSPEKEGFDKFGERLKTLEFGSEEYKANLEELKPVLDHHYENNSHHPQHYADGIDGMNLLDIVEMFCDWTAAVKRTKDGDIKLSLTINQERFNMCSQLVNIFKNTIDDCDWSQTDA